MLGQLSMCRGVSGCEDEVRKLILNAARPICDNVEVDRLGNVIAYKAGKTGAKRVMAAAHMDEVGFIIKSVTDEGFLKFASVGSIDPRVLPGTRLLIGPGAVKGVIGIKAVHLQTPQERENAPQLSDLYIDIGAAGIKEAEDMVSPGDYATYDTAFAPFGKNKVKGKALDDRAGCAVLLELLKGSYDCDFYACFTVQEEVGTRGAHTAAYNIRPDAAIVLETTVCADIYDTAEHAQSTVLGRGAAVSIIDGTSYSDRALVERIMQMAARNGIPVQYRTSAAGGNDAGAIQTSCGGARTAVISIPCRYIHSPSCVLDLGDFDAAVRLSRQFLIEAEAMLDD